MRNGVRVLTLAVAVAACLLFASPARANLITNGSFEAGAYPGGAFATLGTGSMAITGWTVTGHSVDWINTYWQPSDGNFSLDLDGNGQGGISTSVATTIGQDYVLTFDMAGNPDGLPDVKTLRLTVGGGSQDYMFDTTLTSLASMGWVTYSYAFTATGNTTTISFDSQDAGFYGAALDNVTLEAVPEPGTLLLLGSGISALVLRRRRAS